MNVKEKIKYGPGVILATINFYLWGLTLKRKVLNPVYLYKQDTGNNAIYMLFHSDLFVPTFQFRNCGYFVLVSQHKDGEFVSRMIQKLGYFTIRGSSTRGGRKALREIINTLKNGKNVVIIPDGPKGPVGKIKEGILTSSILAEVPIIPVIVSYSKVYRVNSWDSFNLPHPFSKVNILFGKPIKVDKTLKKENFSRKIILIEKCVKKLKKIANKTI